MLYTKTRFLQWAGSVDQAFERKRTLSSGVLGEATLSLPNRMLALSADNIEMSKINTYSPYCDLKKFLLQII